MLVSVIVVSYNTRHKLRHCLSCIEDSHEVIVVDNASSDGSAEMVASEFPRVRLIQNRENRGFGAANNQGLDLAAGELVLFLNSDCYAEAGSIARLAEAIQNGVVATGGRLLNPDGSLQQSSANALTLWAVLCEQLYLEKLFSRSRIFSPYWNTARLPRDRASDTEQVMGACLMMLRGLERFDERFFLYCEDTDLCLRLRQHGRIVYEPRAVFTHELGSSSSRSRWLAIARYNWGKELYFRIHHGSGAAIACLILDRLGAGLRLLVWTIATILTLGIVPKIRRQVATFFRVATASVRPR